MIWSIEDGSSKRPEGVDEDGIPDPAYAAALGLRPAPLGRRAVATLIESATYALLALPFLIGGLPLVLSLAQGSISVYGFVQHPSFVLALVLTIVSTVLTLAFTIVQGVLHGAKGVTLGKALMGIRSVNVATLEKPRFGRVLLRGIVLSASGLVPVVGPALMLASPLLDRQKRGRGWLDLVGRTWFVDAAKGLDPYDVKRMRIARKTVTAEPVAERQAMPSLATPQQHGVQGAYQPGARVSAGVLGVARPTAPGEQQVVGLSTPQPAASSPLAPAPAQAGMPSLGAYRPGELSGVPVASPLGQQGASQAIPPAPMPQVAQQPAPQQPAPQQPAPQQPVPQQPAPQQPAPQQPAPQQPAPQQPAPQQPAPQQPVPQQPVPQQPVPQQPAPQQPAPQQPAPQQPAPQQPAPAHPAASVPDATIVSSQLPQDDDDLGATRITRPQGIVLELDDATRIAVTGRVLLGRNPTLQPGESGTVVPLADHTRSMSKTHAAFDVDGDGLQVTDRHSTNGTSVVRGGVETRLVGGVPVRADVGDAVLLGDRRAVVVRV